MEKIEIERKTSVTSIMNKIKKIGCLDAIVVEGFDGVGKGKVLNELSEILGVEPYRPDYELWQKFYHRSIDRWKISGFFWDVYSHFRKGYLHNTVPFLFDRGVLSGAVYNQDDTIAEHYKEMIRDRKILHVLVTCSREDYYKFAELRKSEVVPTYEEYEVFTKRYIDCLEIAGVEYMIYQNHFIEGDADRLAECCEGCGHYNYGWCRHPKINNKVDKNDLRCIYSTDKEVQDEQYDIEQMQGV